MDITTFMNVIAFIAFVIYIVFVAYVSDETCNERQT